MNKIINKKKRKQLSRVLNTHHTYIEQTPHRNINNFIWYYIYIYTSRPVVITEHKILKETFVVY